MSWISGMARRTSERSPRSLNDSVDRTASPSPPADSRIPTPIGGGGGGSLALRRSASMRVRGERLFAATAHHPRGSSSSSSTVTTTTNTTSPSPDASQRHHREDSSPPHTHSHSHNNHYQHLQQQQQQHYQRSGGPRNHQQHHRCTDHRVFPVITENGTDSPRQRSFSLSLTPARPRSGHAAFSGETTSSGGGGGSSNVDDSDAESVKSYGSACSTASACDHATFALNGTTWSGRSRRYVVHCSNRTDDNEQYLTPTQRAARQVKKFQALLKEARKEIEEKDREIFRLTKEVVELRLYKASLNSPDERTDSSDALTVRENNPFSPESPSKDLPDEGGASLEKTSSPAPETPGKQQRASSDVPSSLADSGHFEDGSVHSKDSVSLPEGPPDTAGNDTVRITELGNKTVAATEVFERDEDERRKLVDLYESRIEEIQRRHVDELQELKQRHNDKVESLLNRLSEVNTRYCDVRPSLDAAEARARELESELEAVKTELEEKKTLLNEQEATNKQMYLKMYAKGQEAARLEQADQILEQARQAPPKVTIADLLRQLTVTQAELENIKAMYRRIVEVRSSHGVLDPEITLQFLKSAIYYFLTDKENHQGHLNAIESILGFTDAEKQNIDRIYRSLRK